MRRVLAPGLRAQLALALAVILALALLGTYVAVYNGTGTQVRAQIDRDLRQDARNLARATIPFERVTPQTIAEAAHDYVERQPSFGPLARLYVIQVAGGPTVTNEPELVGLSTDAFEHETAATRATEASEGRAVLAAPAGLHTFPLLDAGSVRVLTQPVELRRARVATVQIGEPLGAVSRAQESVRHAFVLGGLIALAAALMAVYLVTDRISLRLRRIARTAARVGSGDLDHRIGASGPHDEVRVLADAFDHMLDRLQDAFERQRAFVADASHELRTPLTVIAGQIEVLARQREVSREDVGRVERAVHTEVARMQRLVDDLLLLARADEHELVHRRELELAPFLSELFESLAPSAAERDYRLAPPPAGTIAADPDRIAQVIRNLVSNAIDHTGPGGLVAVAASATDGHLEIAVEDDGEGIPETHRSRVFERFHRTDLARARASGGTGLGLAIARAIVEAHGGRIWAGASASGGARVAFELPGWRATASSADSAAAPRHDQPRP